MGEEYDVPCRPPSELLPDPERGLLLPLLLLVVNLLGAMLGMRKSGIGLYTGESFPFISSYHKNGLMSGDLLLYRPL